MFGGAMSPCWLAPHVHSHAHCHVRWAEATFGLVVVGHCEPLRCYSTHHHTIVNTAITLSSSRGIVIAAHGRYLAMLLPP